MAAIAPITVNDGQATPVAHTFNPIETNPPRYRENGNASVPTIGQSEVGIGSRVSPNASGVDKVTVHTRVPVLETVTGSTIGGMTPAPAIAYYLIAKTEFLLPKRATGAQKKDLRVMHANLLANAQVAAAVDSGEKPY